MNLKTIFIIIFFVIFLENTIVSRKIKLKNKPEGMSQDTYDKIKK